MEKCFCIVVFEEIGFIFLVEKGILNWFLISNRLKELLEECLFLLGSEKSIKLFFLVNIGC